MFSKVIVVLIVLVFFAAAKSASRAKESGQTQSRGPGEPDPALVQSMPLGVFDYGAVAFTTGLGSYLLYSAWRMTQEPLELRTVGGRRITANAKELTSLDEGAALVMGVFGLIVLLGGVEYVKASKKMKALKQMRLEAEAQNDG